MFDTNQNQGEAVLSYRAGWTRLGWADRSVDKRRGSHADVLVNAIMSGEEVLELARATLPTIFARMHYEILVRRVVEQVSK